MLINQFSMYHEGVRPVSVGFTVIFYRCVSKSCPTPPPAEMAFDPLYDFELATFFLRKDIKKIMPRKKFFSRLTPAISILAKEWPKQP